MPILLRDDGAQFVMQAYRELFCEKKKSQLAKEIRFLSEQQGAYIRLFRRDQHQYEVVFSKEPGYLFGETIWYFFDKPDNLIFCEALPDSAQILLVVVQLGSVSIDKQILGAALQSELLPFMTSDLRYQIIISGNVPLRETAQFGTFCFPENLVASFLTLDEPLFPRLQPLKQLQLQPLSLALESESLNFGFSSLVILFVTITVLGAGWWVLSSKPVAFSSVEEASSSTLQSCRHYFKVLSTPEPKEQLLEMIHVLETLYALPGWRVSQLTYRQQHYQVDLILEGGLLAEVVKRARQQHYELQLFNQQVRLRFPTTIPGHVKLWKVNALDPLVTELVDRLHRLLQQNAVHFGITHRDGVAEKLSVIISLESVPPGMLDLLGRELEGLPVQLVSARLHFNSGLLSGHVQLSLWGK